MGIQLMLLASVFVAVSNLCMRKSLDSGGSTKGFLVVQLFSVFLISILLNPVKNQHFAWNAPMALLGVGGGLILALLMTSIGKALESGPAALTFAIINASTVVPILLIVLLFGDSHGFSYTGWQGLGSLLVIGGLFLAAWQAFRLEKRIKWVVFVALAFTAHVFFLAYMQWRSLLINFPGKKALGIAFDNEAAVSQWFMPMVFLTAALIHLVSLAVKDKKLPTKPEATFGVLGGTVNGIGTYFMIRSTEIANNFEQAMIFPVFAVATIIFCNIWGMKLYKEQINWKANGLCILGILVGSLDWSVLLSK